MTEAGTGFLVLQPNQNSTEDSIAEDFLDFLQVARSPQGLEDTRQLLEGLATKFHGDQSSKRELARLMADFENQEGDAMRLVADINTLLTRAQNVKVGLKHELAQRLLSEEALAKRIQTMGSKKRDAEEFSSSPQGRLNTVTQAAKMVKTEVATSRTLQDTMQFDSDTSHRAP